MPILLIPPVVNVIVTGLFAGTILRQYLRRHRAYQLYWSIALSMAVLATLAYVFMIVAQPASSAGVLLFRVYYILGAALMPSWLGLGSLALVSKERITRICLVALCLLSVLAAVFILMAQVNLQKLSQIAGTPGTGILQSGLWLVTIIVLNTLGVIAVVGVAVYSGWKVVRRQTSVAGIRTMNLLWANVLILAGDLLNAAAGTLARFLQVESTFWLIMAVGWFVFFYGVMLTSRRSTTAPSSTTPSSELEQARRQITSS
jgi:hypothetical protein